MPDKIADSEGAAPVKPSMPRQVHLSIVALRSEGHMTLAGELEAWWNDRRASPAQDAPEAVPPSLPQYSVKHGGLMRCCLASLDKQMCDPTKNPPKEGDVLDCEYETPGNKRLLYRDGYWQWNRPENLNV